MRRTVIALALLGCATAARAQQVTEPEVQSSAQTGGSDAGQTIDNDPTSLSGRGGTAIKQKTYQETIGTPIGTEIRTEIGTRMGVPH